MSLPKEPHFFDFNYERGLERYQKRFAEGQGRAAIGEATPSYLSLPFVAERISRDLPDARLVVALRDPIERAHSEWWMLYSRRQERCSFEEAIQRNREQLRRGIDFLGASAADDWRAAYGSLNQGRVLHRTYLSAGHYADQLACYHRWFPTERVHVVLADDLRADRQGTMRKLWTFLGVSADQSLADESEHNEALGGLAAHVVGTVRRLGLQNMVATLPYAARQRVKRWLAGDARRPVMRSETRHRLRDYFAPQVDALARLLQRDLSGWQRERVPA
jgi:hypothetical protein